MFNLGFYFSIFTFWKRNSHIFVTVPSKDMDFQLSYVVVFLCSMIWGERWEVRGERSLLVLLKLDLELSFHNYMYRIIRWKNPKIPHCRKREWDLLVINPLRTKFVLVLQNRPSRTIYILNTVLWLVFFFFKHSKKMMTVEARHFRH